MVRSSVATAMRFARLRYMLFAAALFVGVVITLRSFLVYEKEKVHQTSDNRRSSHHRSFADVESTTRIGLRADGPSLTLDGVSFRIFSGALHYFRIPHEYWRDRLEKLVACGLNTVETYIPWNLHEQIRGSFDFSNEIYDLDLVAFVKLAQSLGLYVILRPGPYICAEWDFGGLPGWLLNDKQLKVRSLQSTFKSATEQYFAVLIRKIAPLQYVNGGPVIAVQVENEFGSYGHDPDYLRWLKEVLVSNDIRELLFTSDGSKLLENGTLPDVFATVNFQRNSSQHFERLKVFQRNKPLMVGEFWSGWFDHWGEYHHNVTDEQYTERLTDILSANASVSLYMFHGGTNFGFLNGANRNYTDPNDLNSAWIYQPTVTSYDYDAPLSENGHLTSKWFITRDLMSKYNPVFNPEEHPIPQKDLPRAIAYDAHPLRDYLTLTDLLDRTTNLAVAVDEPQFMEMVCRKGPKIAADNMCVTQNFGFISYRKLATVGTINNEVVGATVKLLIQGHINDRAVIVVNGETVATVDAAMDVPRESLTGQTLEISLPFPPAKNQKGEFDIVILVENMGRVNYQRAPFKIDDQRKGFSGTVQLNGREFTNWTINNFDFSTDFLTLISSMEAPLKEKAANIPAKQPKQPAFYRTVLPVTEVADTFLDMEDWTKGVVFLRQFNLGRYWNIGPQKTLFVPAPKLKLGENEIIVFELHKPANKLKFIADAKL